MNSTSDTSNKLTKISGLTENLLIPERTRSLLWVTDNTGPDSGIAAFDPLSGEAMYGEGIILADSIDNLQAEPSLIWTRLPVEPNRSKLPTRPIYYPTFRGLSPQRRFQYLSWLTDIKRPTFLSYVFLYFYGLERHLILGDFEAAVEEIKLLIKHHDIGAYAYNDLALASVIKGRNILDLVPEIEDHLIDPAWLRAYYEMSLTPTVALKYAHRAGFTNTRYVKLHPELFSAKLQQSIDELEGAMGGKFFRKFKLSGYGIGRLINVSLKGYSENIKIPSTQEDNEFERIIYSLLVKAHTNTRLVLHPNTVIRKSNKQVMNSAQKRELIDELDAAIEKLETQYRKSEPVEEDATDTMPVTKFNKSITQLENVNRLADLNPDLAIISAYKLINSGYRAPAIYESLARAYIKKDDHKSALDTLMQAKLDYGYNFQWQLRGILDRLRSDLSKIPSPHLTEHNKSIDDLVSKRERSSWAGLDKSLELSLAGRDKLHKKVSKIWHLGKTKPEESLKQAFKLFDEGHRTEFICRCIAAGYRRQNKYEEEVDFLVQIKRDFEYYDFDNTLRQAIKLQKKVQHE